MSALATLPPRRTPRRNWERILLSLHTGAVYAFLYVPILVLIAFSFNSGEQTAVWEGFTFDWYAKLLHNEQMLRAVKNSAIVSAVTTVVATVLGTLAALALARYNFFGKAATQSALYLPIIIPEIVLGAALVTFFGVVELRLSLATVIFGHIAFCISYVAIVVRARLAGFDKSLEEAALDLGASPFETFRRVTLPIILPGIISGALLAFTISIDDYVITSFVAGVGSTTLPILIYSMLKVNVTPEVNAVSTLLLLFTVALIVIAQRLQRDPH